MIRLLSKIFVFLKLDILIQSIINTGRINNCEKGCTSNNSRFWEQASVFNFQNNKRKIMLGSGTNVRGELLVFPYGGEITIGDYCYIGENSRIWSGEKITLGNHVLISHNVTIIDTNSHEMDYIERSSSYKKLIETHVNSSKKENIITSPIIIEDHAWISFNVSILKGVKIGMGAIVGAGSVVVKDVEPFTIVAGNPAVFIKKIN